MQFDLGMAFLELRPFGVGFLHAILAKHALVALDDRLDRFDWESLGDRHQGDRRGIALRLYAGTHDLVTHGSEWMFADRVR